MAWEFVCPICHSDEMVLPVGSKKSPILVVGDSPGVQELKEGKPFVGGTGGVLMGELSRHLIDMRKLRITNLWLHPKNKSAECLDYGAKKVIEEAQGKKVILLIGSDTVKYFCDMSVEERNGLIIPSKFFSSAIVMACVQPSTAFHGGLGEVRFALTQFANLLKKEALL